MFLVIMVTPLNLCVRASMMVLRKAGAKNGKTDTIRFFKDQTISSLSASIIARLVSKFGISGWSTTLPESLPCLTEKKAARIILSITRKSKEKTSY